MIRSGWYVLAMLAVAYVAEATSFQDLGTLDFEIRKLSENGQVAIGNSSVGSISHGYRWDRATGQVTELTGPDEYSDSVALYNVSADGSVIVGFDLNANRAIAWYDNVPIILGAGIAYDVSPDGSVIVGTSDDQAVKWDADGMSILNAVGSDSSAKLISSSGVIAGVTGFPGTLWSRDVDGTITTISSIVLDRILMDISVDGSVIIGSYLHIEDGSGSLLSFPGTTDYVHPRSLDASGTFTVGYVNLTSGSVAVIHDTDHGARDLNEVLSNEYGLDLTGWTLTSAKGISGDGTTIIGHGVGPNGSNTWMAVIPVHPGDLNADNIVDASDLQILGDHWHDPSANRATGDFNGDGVVDLSDLQILGDNWGFGTSTDLTFEQAMQQAGIEIPEPVAAMICAMAFVLIAARRQVPA